MDKIVYLNILLLIGVIHTQWNIISANTLPSDNSNTVQEESHYIFQTSSGPVEGKLVKGITEKKAFALLGIPYAEPPIGKLRFLPPEPVKPWSEVFKATEPPLPCYQHYTSQYREESRKSKTLVQRPWSEDCLTLNIWVPNPIPSNAPVLVIFHSGGFSTGSGTFPILDGTTLAAEAVDLVVTMNYRLGPFGFLGFGVPQAPGNVGLLDQQLALKWIKENIHNFGGKSSAVIIVGAGGAGSASVGYHVISKGSADLFKTAAMFAGSVLCPYAFQTKDVNAEKSHQLSYSLGCNKDTIDEKIECLRDAHPEDIVDAAEMEFDYSGDTFKPTVDGTFITEAPKEAMAAGRFNKVAVLSIINANEGSSILKRVNPDVMSDPEKGITLEGFRTAMRRILPNVKQSGLNAIEEQYISQCSLGNPIQIREAAIRAYSNMITDCCVNLMLDYVVQHGNPAFFCVDNLTRASDPSWLGASHAMSVLYILGYPLDQKKYGFNSLESETSVEFIKWIDVHTSKRNVELARNVTLYNLNDRPYVYWDPFPHNRTHYMREECILWNEIIPKLMKTESDTCIKSP